jgi:hypothetical protein
MVEEATLLITLLMLLPVMKEDKKQHLTPEQLELATAYCTTIFTEVS